MHTPRNTGNTRNTHAKEYKEYPRIYPTRLSVGEISQMGPRRRGILANSEGKLTSHRAHRKIRRGKLRRGVGFREYHILSHAYSLSYLPASSIPASSIN